MKKLLVILLILQTGYLQSQTINVGIRVQKTKNMYWENGFSVQYTFKNFKPEQFHLGFDFVTSRLGSAFGSNAIKQSHFLLSGSWSFFPEKSFHFITRLNIGYFHSDLEYDFFDDIPNSSFLLSPEIGISYIIPQLPVAFQLGSGYYIDFAKPGYSPGTLLPLYYHLDIYYTLFKSGDHE
jgi:hypothetical protein